MDTTQKDWGGAKHPILLQSGICTCCCCSNLAKCFVNDGVTHPVTSCKLFWAFHQSTAQHADPLCCETLVGIDWTACRSRCPSSHPLSHLSAAQGREMNPQRISKNCSRHSPVPGGHPIVVAFWGYTCQFLCPLSARLIVRAQSFRRFQMCVLQLLLRSTKIFSQREKSSWHPTFWHRDN